MCKVILLTVRGRVLRVLLSRFMPSKYMALQVIRQGMLVMGALTQPMHLLDQEGFEVPKSKWLARRGLKFPNLKGLPIVGKVCWKVK